MTGGIPPFASSVLNNMRHQPHIPLHQHVSRLQIALGAAGEVELFLLLAEGFGEAPGASGEMQGQKKAAAQQQHRGSQHNDTSFFLRYASGDCPYSLFLFPPECAMVRVTRKSPPTYYFGNEIIPRFAGTIDCQSNKCHVLRLPRKGRAKRH